MKVSCLLLTCELAICDGGHCLQIFQSRLFTCEVLSVCFLFWVGGLVHLWKITVELPRSQGSLPDKPEASELHVFLSLGQTYIADVFPGYAH